MKKSTIKRRKRVVPALQEQLSDRSQQISLATSTSPETPPASISEAYEALRRADSPANFYKRRQQSTPTQERRWDPPAVDFTGYEVQRSAASLSPSDHRQMPSPFQPPLPLPPMQDHPSPSHPMHNSIFQPQSLHQQSFHQLHSPPSDHTRKRTFSIAEGTQAEESATPPERRGSASSNSRTLNPISALLNPPSQQNDHNSAIDPALANRGGPTISPQAQNHQLHAPGPTLPPIENHHHEQTATARHKDNDRERLTREREQLMAMLEAKDFELAQLDKG